MPLEQLPEILTSCFHQLICCFAEFLTLPFRKFYPPSLQSLKKNLFYCDKNGYHEVSSLKCSHAQYSIDD